MDLQPGRHEVNVARWPARSAPSSARSLSPRRWRWGSGGGGCWLESRFSWCPWLGGRDRRHRPPRSDHVGGHAWGVLWRV